MSKPELRLEVHLSSEVAPDAHHALEILVGARALLRHPHRHDAVEGARKAVSEACAVLERITRHLDAYATMQAEEQRNLAAEYRAASPEKRAQMEAVFLSVERSAGGGR